VKSQLFRLDSGEVVEGLKENTDLEVRLLGRVEELKQDSDDISKVQDDAKSHRSEIVMLRTQIYQERAEKLDLMHKVRGLEKDLERRKCKIDKLRTDELCQSRRYDELWRSHGELMGAQKLRSQVSILNSDSGRKAKQLV